MTTKYSTYCLVLFLSLVPLCAWCIVSPVPPLYGSGFGSGSGSGSGFSGEEIIIPSRFQRSYPMYGLYCFPDGLRLPCECYNKECPCCHDWITQDCYRPTFYKWSHWLPCLECNDLCDETQECRIKYDEATPDFGFWHEYSPAPNRRRRSHDETGTMVHPFLDRGFWEWLHGPGKERCQVQRTECRPKQEGTWSDWIPSGPCSEECGQGTQIIIRHCLDENNNHVPDEDCGSGESTGFQPCNVDLCETIGEWVGVGSCYIEDGECIQNATRTCDEGTPLTKDCSVGTIPCAEECSFGTWGPWVPSGPCPTNCTVGLVHATRDCLNSDGDVIAYAECEGGVGASGESQDCNEERCVEYSSWENTGECDEPCGGGTITQSRSCDEFGTDPNYTPPNDCTTRIASCNTEPCVEPGDWGDWGPCSPTCTPGLETRTRPCVIIGTTTVTTGCDPAELVENQPCGAVDLCTGYGDYAPNPGSKCQASQDSCQVPQADLIRSCTGVGEAPPDCLMNRGPCTPDTPAKVLDILVVIDAGKFIDGPSSSNLCTDNGDATIEYPNTVLDDDTVLPNFVNLKNFLNAFVCSFHNISTDEARLAIYRNIPKAPCIDLDPLSTFPGTDNLLVEIQELDLVCTGPNTFVSLHCADQALTLARADGADIILLVVSELVNTVKADINFALTSPLDGMVRGYIDGKVFAVVYAGENPTTAEKSELLSIACMVKGPAKCPNYLGTTRDDVHSIIDKLMNLSPFGEP